MCLSMGDNHCHSSSPGAIADEHMEIYATNKQQQFV